MPSEPVRGARTAIGLVLAFLLLLPAVTVRLNASDEIEYFAWLRSWAFDRDVDFENEYRHFHDLAPDKHVGLRQTFLEGTNEAGRRPNFAPIGTAILWSPFYAVGHLVAIATDAAQDGYSGPYLAAVAYGSAIYGLLALLLAGDFTRRRLAIPTAWSTWAIWIGSPLLFYMYVAPGFSHTASAFAVSLFLWTWVRVRGTWSLGGTILLGALAGLLPMVREQDAFFIVAPALDFLRWAWRQASNLRAPVTGASSVLLRVASPAAAGLVAAVAIYTPQLLAYSALNGHAGPTTIVMRKMTWSSPHFWGVLLSPEHGLLWWTPLALVALAGLVWLAVAPAPTTARDRRWIATLLVLLVVLQIYVSGCVESWTVAGSFGQRRFVALTPLLVAGLAAVITAVDPRTIWRRALAGSVLLCVWWNLGLMAQFGLHLMDRQRLEPGRNASVTFLELPRRAPAIVWRYWTDRESLFDLPRRE